MSYTYVRSAAAGPMMAVLRVVPAGTTHPFGDHRSVDQAFPKAIPSAESDPFLMCDSYAFVSDGVEPDPDRFPVDWHPHRGMDILSYLKTGVGRHGDSMGNREKFETPGMQWISCGSGIEHAEGGATPRGELGKGFQIWINVPAGRKMDDPKYGTEPPEAIPQREVSPGVNLRLLAGQLGDDARIGRFRTVQPVQMVDIELSAGKTLEFSIADGLDTCMVFVYEGAATISGGHAVATKSIALLDASSDDARRFELSAGSGSAVAAMLFAGKKLNEPIAWHGPIVMNTQEEVQQTIQEIRAGRFPPKRVAWDYKRLASFPSE